MYGVVLAGGGAKGAYEVGALKAIREENIKVGAVCGTSIGSINAALYAQGDFEKCEQIWQNVTIADIVDMTVFSNDKLVSIKNIGAFLDEMRTNRGISLSPLENILKEVISEEKLLLSPIDFGLVTYSVSDSKAVEIFKADIPKGMLIEYLMASSALLGARSRIIDDKTYVDGAMGDNKPVNMLINKGYRDIIAIDVGGMGVIKPYAQNGVNIIEVKCPSSFLGILDFDNKRILDAIRLGYLDTKRAFGKITGDIYPIRTNDYLRARRKYSKEIMEGLECAAEIYGIDKLKEYTAASLIKKVVSEFRKCSPEVERRGLTTLTSPKLIFTKICLLIAEGGGERITKIAATLLKKYAKAANSVCYFIKKLEF